MTTRAVGAAGPVPAGQVSAEMHVSTATMTSVLDTLERNVLPEVQQIVTATLSPLGEETLHTLLDALDAANAAMDAAPRDLPPPAPRRRPPQLRPN